VVLLLSLHLTRTVNIPLLCGLAGLAATAPRLLAGRPPWLLALCCVHLGWTAYFMTGNSHSLASIDLAGAYTAAAEYQQLLVGALVFLSIYAGPGVCFSCFLASATPQSRSWWAPLLLLVVALDLCSAQLAFWVFQHHLFVWSVFAPKVIFAILHSAFAGVFIASTALWL
jgi:hypothetical protein